MNLKKVLSLDYKTIPSKIQKKQTFNVIVRNPNCELNLKIGNLTLLVVF